MREHDRAVVTGLVIVLLLLWLGFLVHRSPDFAGSPWGGLFGVTGALLMLVPLAYSLVKRLPVLRRAVTARLSMRTFLVWHIYAGLAGAALVLVHTGHKFQSTLGIALTAMTLLVVLSGFVGRYLLGFISEDTREKQAQLSRLRAEYERAAAALAGATPESWAGFSAVAPASARALPLVESMADLEYAIRAESRVRAFFSRWLKFHLMISLILYLLLALHVWAALEFGLRWFG